MNRDILLNTIENGLDSVDKAISVSAFLRLNSLTDKLRLISADLAEICFSLESDILDQIIPDVPEEGEV